MLPKSPIIHQLTIKFIPMAFILRFRILIYQMWNSKLSTLQVYWLAFFLQEVHLTLPLAFLIHLLHFPESSFQTSSFYLSLTLLPQNFLISCSFALNFCSLPSQTSSFSFQTNHLILSQTIHPSTQIYAIYTSIERIPSFLLHLSYQVQGKALSCNLPLESSSHSKNR